MLHSELLAREALADSSTGTGPIAMSDRRMKPVEGSRRYALAE